MFGYVKIHKPELKVKEYEQYKAVYCTLCKCLGKRYGHLIRMTLNYDFAFLAMLLLSANKSDVEFVSSKCVYNPFKKCNYTKCDNLVYDFVSAAAVIMLYYKVVDDIRDAKGFGRCLPSLFKTLIKVQYKKACLNYPQISDIIQTMNSEQINAENIDLNIDSVSEPTANALGRICELSVDDDKKRIMYRIGYCIGKWVYLIDALDDREKDVKNKCYNAVLNLTDESVVSNLNVCSNEAGASFELLDDTKFSNIIRNVLYLGMPAEVGRILIEKEKNNARSL